MDPTHQHPESPITMLTRQPRVFLAEDDDEMRAFLCWALRTEGCDVLGVVDGREMLARVQAVFLGQIASPDVIVTDQCMPGYSGLGVLALVRRACLKIPVILITAFGDDVLHTLARESDAARVLDKPFAANELLDAIIGAHLDHMQARIRSKKG